MSSFASFMGAFIAAGLLGFGVGWVFKAVRRIVSIAANSLE